MPRPTWPEVDCVLAERAADGLNGVHWLGRERPHVVKDLGQGEEEGWGEEEEEEEKEEGSGKGLV